MTQTATIPSAAALALANEAYTCAANCHMNAAAIGEGWEAMAAGFMAAGDCLTRRTRFWGTLVQARKAGYDGQARNMFSATMYAALPLDGITLDAEGYIVL